MPFQKEQPSRRKTTSWRFAQRVIKHRFSIRGASFTLIELLVVISLIGLLAAVVSASFQGTQEQARLAKYKYLMASIHHALAAYMEGIWTFDGDTNDSSGYGRHGTIVSGSLQSQDACGKVNLGGCMYFTGDDEGIRMNDYYTKLVPASSEQYHGPVTILAWAKPTALDNTDRFIFVEEDEGNYNEAYVSVRSSEIRYRWRWIEFDDDVGYVVGEGTDFAVPKTMELNRWHLIILVVERPGEDVSRLKGYLDGELMGDVSFPCEGSCGPEGNLHIGHKFIGFIDEVRIYGKAFTAAQIQKLYAQELQRYRLSEK